MGAPAERPSSRLRREPVLPFGGTGCFARYGAGAGSGVIVPPLSDGAGAGAGAGSGAGAGAGSGAGAGAGSAAGAGAGAGSLWVAAGGVVVAVFVLPAASHQMIARMMIAMMM